MAGWPRCTRHDGRHLDVYGQCVHVGAPVAIRIGPCPTCGEDVAFSRDLASGRVTVLEAGSDRRHADRAPVRVELDPDDLAAAIVNASRAVGGERRGPSPPPPTPDVPEPGGVGGERRGPSPPPPTPDVPEPGGRHRVRLD